MEPSHAEHQPAAHASTSQIGATPADGPSPPRVTITTRRAEPTDAEVVASILEDGFAHLRPQYTPAGFAATVLDREGIVARIKEGPVWLAFVDDTPAGTVSAVPSGRDCYIRGMAVRPEATRSGLGRALLDAVFAYGAEIDAAGFRLHTTPFLDAAIALYRSAGFAFVTNTDKPDLHGTPLLAMAKKR